MGVLYTLLHMEPTKRLRGDLLRQFLDKKGGASAAIGAVLDKGSAKYNSTLSFASQCIRVGFGEMAAQKWEELFEPLGMSKGYLTQPTSQPTLSGSTPYTVNPSSDTTVASAPVFEWARMGIVLDKEVQELDVAGLERRAVTAKISSKGKFFVSPVDMPSLNIWANWLVLIDPIDGDEACQDGRPYLFEKIDGTFFLAKFQRRLDGFEAFPESGASLTSAGHGIKVVGRYCGSQEA